MTVESKVVASVSCPLCHTMAPLASEEALAGGGAWRCPHCDQNWSDPTCRRGRLFRVLREAISVVEQAPKPTTSSAIPPRGECTRNDPGARSLLLTVNFKTPRLESTIQNEV